MTTVLGNPFALLFSRLLLSSCRSVVVVDGCNFAIFFVLL